ncbi:MAG: winged helix-turn-helix transcriptional regulator [Paracoccaceae bacterium]
MDINSLVNVSARAWSVPLLAALGEGVEGRQAVLIKHLGASRSAFGLSLAHLQSLDLVRRRAGHGHPLRPEFALTEKGEVAAKAAQSVMRIVHRNPDAITLVSRSWTLPILSQTTQPAYFAMLRNGLAPITDRALSQGLKSLEDMRWIHREVAAGSRPPRPMYSAVGTGAAIAAALDVQIV